MPHSTLRRSALAILLVLGVAAVYAPTARLPFVAYDDPDYVSENPHVTQGLTWAGAACAFTAFHAHNWHPITWLSHMLDVQLYGLRPFGHHLTNVLLHLAGAMLLLFVLERMTKSPGPSAFTAFLFALHPLRVESVAWVAERKDVLSGLFFMLVLAAWTYYAERPSWNRYAAVFVCLALGLMSKPMLVTTPLVLLLLDDWPLGRWAGRIVDRGAGAPVSHRDPAPSEAPPQAFSGAKLVLEKLPLVALCVVACLLTLRAQASAIAPFERVTAGARVANAVLSYGLYLGKYFRPANLSCFYPRLEPLPASWVALSGAMLVAITAGAWIARRRAPYVLTGWLWFLVMLVPVIGLVQVGWQAMADRYMYLPSIGLGLIVSWGARDIAMAADRSGRAGFPRALAAAAVLVVLLLSVLSVRQLRFWSSTERLFQHAIDVTGGNYDIEVLVGNELYQSQDWEGAARHYAAALERVPGHPLALYNLGMAQLRLGETARAVESLTAAKQADPSGSDVRANLCVALDALGRTPEAAAACEEALRLDPRNPAALNALAWIRATGADESQRNGVEAVDLAERAVALAGLEQRAATLDTLAAALAEQGRFLEAEETERRAIALAGAASDGGAEARYSARLVVYAARRPFRSGADAAPSGR